MNQQFPSLCIVMGRFQVMGGESNAGFRVWRLDNSTVSSTYETLPEAMALRNWLHERSLDYPKLDLPWPTETSMAQGAYPWYFSNNCGDGACCKR